jgi:DnaK suppressor protein
MDCVPMVDVHDRRKRRTKSRMLKTQRKRYFRSLLHQKIQELAEKTGGSRMNWDIKGTKSPDLIDWATAEREREVVLRIMERDAALREEVRLALEKISNGTYGLCESCEQEIESERLEALPVTALCIECKRKEEAKERWNRHAT